VCKLLVARDSSGWVRSAHDCAEGGLAIALSKLVLVALGAEINLGLTITQLKQSRRWDDVLFGEGGARILVSVSPEQRVFGSPIYSSWGMTGKNWLGGSPTHLYWFTADNHPLIEVRIEQMSVLQRYSTASNPLGSRGCLPIN